MYVERMLPVARERLATVKHDAPLMAAAKLLDGRHINLVVVCDDSGRMVGVITKTDIVRQMGRCDGSGCTTGAARMMSRDVTYCQPSDLAHHVWSMMKERGLFHVPVVDDNLAPLGVINARDVLLVLLEGSEYEEALLRDYVMGIGYR